MKPLRLLHAPAILLLLASIALAKVNPVPQLNQPLIPMTVKPGAEGFTLTVNGTGFASTAVVTWNGSTRITNFISSTQLQAIIKTEDIAQPGTASVAVVNPSPGGGASNAVFFPVQTPVPSAVLRQGDFTGTGITAVGDFNNDGILDLAVATSSSTGFFISVYFGNGDGTFHGPFQNHSATPITYMVTADFNGDGKLDIAALDGLGNITVFLNHGDGALIQQQVFRSLSTHGIRITGPSDNALAAADFNGDGKLDLLVTGNLNAGPGGAVYLGNGDGTFGSPQSFNLVSPLGNPAIGDFNGDGKLDLAVPDGASVHVLLGNGDGTFQAGVTYQTAYGGFSAAAADVNGDGKLDIVTDGVSVLLGNGDGTFTSDGGVNLDTGDYFASGVNIADFNGDGKLDVAVGDPIYLLLGNGDGTFQNATLVASDDNLISLGMGDFNGDGKIDLIGHSVYLQIPINLYPSHLDFKDEKIGIKSPPKTVTVTNDSSSALTISNIGITGFDPKDFAETNDCPASLPIGANCKIKATFQPRAKGLRDATLDVTYEGFGSRKGVGLSGYGEVSTVKLAPPQLEFPTQPVGTDSSPQKATLTNTGDVTVNISNISATGAFTEKNNCPAALAAGANCQIEVEFAPQQKGAAAGKLSVKDDAEGSPQTVALSGTGTVVKLSSGGVNFGDQKVGTKSQPAPVQLTNVGTVSLTIDQIVIKGADPGDFSQTNNCGKSVPAGGSCTIKVIFDPQATGSRSASLQINDNGGGSPQKVSLSGTGT